MTSAHPPGPFFYIPLTTNNGLINGVFSRAVFAAKALVVPAGSYVLVKNIPRIVKPVTFYECYAAGSFIIVYIAGIYACLKFTYSIFRYYYRGEDVIQEYYKEQLGYNRRTVYFYKRSLDYHKRYQDYYKRSLADYDQARNNFLQSLRKNTNLTQQKQQKRDLEEMQLGLKEMRQLLERTLLFHAEVLPKEEDAESAAK